MEYTGFTVQEHSVVIGEKEYTVRSCTPKLSQSEYELRKKQMNDKLYSIFSEYSE